MKKIFCLALTVMFVISAIAVFNVSAADVTGSAKKAATAPTIDGTITEQEWGQPVLTMTKANYSGWFMDPVPDADMPYMPEGADIYVTWTDTGLYLGAVVHDPNHLNSHPIGGDNWNGSAVEFDVGFNLSNQTDRNRNTFALNSSNQCTGYMYRQEVGVNGATTANQNDAADTKATYKVARSGEYTTYEVYFKWSDITPNGVPSAGDKMWFVPQLIGAEKSAGSGSVGSFCYGNKDGGNTVFNQFALADANGSVPTSSPTETSATASSSTTSTEASNPTVSSTTKNNTTANPATTANNTTAAATTTTKGKNPSTGDTNSLPTSIVLMGALAGLATVCVKLKRAKQ